MGKGCVVYNCRGNSRDHLTVHSFPKDNNLHRLWVQFVNVKRQWVAPENTPEHRKSSGICTHHFKPDCYNQQKKKICALNNLSWRAELLPNSVPTIHTTHPDLTICKPIPEQGACGSTSPPPCKRPRKVPSKLLVSRVSTFSNVCSNLLISGSINLLQFSLSARSSVHNCVCSMKSQCCTQYLYRCYFPWG